jgi:hypothetical protein
MHGRWRSAGCVAAAQLGDTSAARSDATDAARAFEGLGDGLSNLQLGLAQLQFGDIADARNCPGASLPALREPHD